jgi:hypothetical protein
MGSLLWRAGLFSAHRIIEFADCLLRQSRSRRQRAVSIGLMPRRILSQIAHDVIIIIPALAYSDYDRDC